jgi:hypothetical protein
MNVVQLGNASAIATARLGATELIPKERVLRIRDPRMHENGHFADDAPWGFLSVSFRFLALPS